MNLVDRAPRHVFFTGKGGVGKTSVACATAVALAARGRRVLLVSTDPASNLDEVLETELGPLPLPVAGVPGLSALNIDPKVAALAYRERMVGPYRGILPDAAVRSIEEQLSGACTVEIAAFDEFSKLLGDASVTGGFDHILFDTAPTGHTLRLLELPGAWTEYLESSAGGTSCLGPLAGLREQQSVYAASRRTLVDATETSMVLVARPESSTLAEAERTRRELLEIGIQRQELVLNGIFRPTDASDRLASAMEATGQRALESMPGGLRALPRTELPLLPFGMVGQHALRRLFYDQSRVLDSPFDGERPVATSIPSLTSLIGALEEAKGGVILTVGKGGVGKTSVALLLAAELAQRGHLVHLTTTDPAADFRATNESSRNIRTTRIDPAEETRRYSEEVLRTAGVGLDSSGRALLEEDLRSPCTEEVAVFRAFARVVGEGESGFVVIDTAPTGHTLLLLDAAESYHREVLRTAGHAPEDVRRLLPRLRDPSFTKVVIVTLAEATPVHEAADLQRDLERAGIKPFAWVINQSLVPLEVSDPVLKRRRASEARFHEEVLALAPRTVLVPWQSDRPVRRENRHDRIST